MAKGPSAKDDEAKGATRARPAKAANKRPRILRHRALGRLLLSAVIGFATFFFFGPTNVVWWVRAVIGWDAAALTLVVLLWSVILHADADETRRRCALDDPGRSLVFAVALGSSLFSLFAAGFVLRQIKGLDAELQGAWTLLTLAAIGLSWVVTHTLYTLRYAHLHYRRGQAQGFTFPGSEAPSDVDFAYFAFTIGMCFQVSDVVVTTSRVRRAVLLHAILAFTYNTAILALALNVVLGLMT